MLTLVREGPTSPSLAQPRPSRAAARAGVPCLLVGGRKRGQRWDWQGRAAAFRV